MCHISPHVVSCIWQCQTVNYFISKYIIFWKSLHWHWIFLTASQWDGRRTGSSRWFHNQAWSPRRARGWIDWSFCVVTGWIEFEPIFSYMLHSFGNLLGLVHLKYPPVMSKAAMTRATARAESRALASSGRSCKRLWLSWSRGNLCNLWNWHSVHFKFICSFPTVINSYLTLNEVLSENQEADRPERKNRVHK